MNEEKFLVVIFFLTKSGKEPVRDWLRSIDKEERKVIGEDIKLVQFRWPLGMPLVRKMEANLWEVRSKFKNGKISRVFFTVKGSQMILLHGFIKKTQKTPLNEIYLARMRMKQWLSEVEI